MVKEAFESLGGRKYFGFVVSIALLAVVAVFAPTSNFGELAAAIAAIYGLFVGGNVLNTIRAPAQINLPEMNYPTESVPSVDLTPVFSQVDELTAKVEEASITAKNAGEAALQLSQQVAALKNLTAAALAAKK